MTKEFILRKLSQIEAINSYLYKRGTNNEFINSEQRRYQKLLKEHE